ncbi:MAG: hypothetical protein ACXW4L_05815 [Candidatus Limnocylindrales bacterium]
MAGLLIFAIMASAFILLDLAALRWGVDTRPLDLTGRRPGPLGTR